MELNFSHSALLIVDMQNDFCPGGALEVKNGDTIIKNLNSLAYLFTARNGRVITTQDWHPEDHASFASSHEGKKPYDRIDLHGVKGQVLWPTHCVQGSRGADFHKDLDMKPVNFIIRKGFRNDLDSYSTFFENDRRTSTGLDGILKSLSINTIVIGGLATDYCVLYSAFDAAILGYKTIVIEDAVCGIDYPIGSIKKAFEIMGKAGAIIASSGEIN